MSATFTIAARITGHKTVDGRTWDVTDCVRYDGYHYIVARGLYAGVADSLIAYPSKSAALAALGLKEGEWVSVVDAPQTIG